MSKRRNITPPLTGGRENPANDDGSVSENPSKLRKQNRRLLEDKDICENLMNESDDNFSDFDDDVGDPDFILESEHDTESEQSDDDDVEVAYAQGRVEEVCHREINFDFEDEEHVREVGADRSQDIREQSEEEIVVREEQHGAAETTIGEAQHSEVKMRNDQVSEDLRTEPEPNEESTGELPRYFYGKNRYKWASFRIEID